MKLFTLTEWLVLAIVLLSTLTLINEPMIEEEEEKEVSNIAGTITLSTRSAMDSLGLEDFKQGAIATIDLESNNVFSTNCGICTNDPVGIQLTGSVNLTNLACLSGGGTGRLEGKLNMTHLREYSSDNLISREWILIDWDAAEFSSDVEVLIVHDPPKWMPDDRYQASFISVEGNDQSRSGPWLSVEKLLGNALNLRGCLPDSFNCNGTNRQEINLTSTLSEITPATEVDIPTEWQLYEGVTNTVQNPVISGNLRGIFNTGNTISQEEVWCHSSDEEITALKSWEVEGSGGNTISPMGIWLDALGLSSSSFTPTNGVWSEIDFDDSACSSFTNSKGDLLFSASIS